MDHPSALGGPAAAAPGRLPIRVRRQQVTRHAGVVARGAGITSRALARRTYAAVRRDPALAERARVSTAEEVAHALGDAHGALMKLGQMASFIDQRLPVPMRDALRRLQDDAPCMAPELVEEVVTEELGAPPDQVFQTWDPEPIAAASIGQVHRATTLDGRAVAVKVQYPGVGDAVAADLASAGLLLHLLRPIAPSLQIRPLVAEITARVSEEVDYEREADHQRRFVEAFRGHPHIAVPATVDELCTGRVLTTELVAGATFAEACSWSQHERNLAGETILRFSEHALHHLSALHGDPHPGNLRFHGDGRITVLDFGMVKWFDASTMSDLRALTRACTGWPDPDALDRAVTSLGYLPAGHGVPADELRTYFGHFFVLVSDGAPLAVTPELASATIDRYVDPDGAFHAVLDAATIPQEMTVLQRSFVQTIALLGDLRACADWRAVAAETWPWTEEPSNTQLGRAHVAWRRERRHI